MDNLCLPGNSEGTDREDTALAAPAVGAVRSGRDAHRHFEALLADLLEGCGGAPDDQLDAEIVRAIRRVVETLDLDQGILIHWGQDPSRLAASHSWTVPGGLPVSSAPDPPALPWFFQRARAGNTISFSRMDELPAEAERDKGFFHRARTRSLASLPLKRDRRTIGALLVASQTQEIAWPDEMVRRLQLIAHVLAGAVARRPASPVWGESGGRPGLVTVGIRKPAHLRQEAPPFVGNSAALSQAVRHAEQAAATDSTVLLLGETGTGKELLAQHIHAISPRASKAFVATNVAAIPATLLEGELFGREKGAYTGALTKEIGRFELADGGTLFLDEVGEMPMETQVKLLRVLQTGAFERLGSSRPLRVDVRVVAATNRKLPELIQAGLFRQDLFYRLNVFPLTLPPLRDRLDDIPLLAWTFVNELAGKVGKAFERIRPTDLDRLRRYAWPGNVRELRNVVERSMILSDGPELRLLPPEGEALGGSPSSRRLADVQRQHILEVLKSTRNRIHGAGGAAEILGLKPSTLYSLMGRLGIPRTR